MSPANRQRFWVTWKLGLYLRAASLLAETASHFASTITIRHKRKEVDAKSPLSIITLGAAFGAEVFVTVDGPDGREAMRAIAEAFATDFGGSTESRKSMLQHPYGDMAVACLARGQV